MSVLTECARGDVGIINLIQRFDADGKPLIIPAMTVTGATVELGGNQDQLAVISGLCRLDSASVPAVNDFKDGVEIGQVLVEVEACVTSWDAHAVTEALLHRCPILTADYARWKDVIQDLPGGPTVVEIADLGD
ncbi:hypothetical protein ACQPYK_09095 [Streptosporangium sp. CA-135522]|uniref:hypothetical protein n=1 Tax=Streptosporangium sp. CA-135522 TaxID=3240072 RepID=UPI003D9503FF